MSGRRQGRLWEPSLRAEIEAAWRDRSLTQDQIAERFATTKMTLRRIARVYGFGPRPPGARPKLVLMDEEMRQRFRRVLRQRDTEKDVRLVDVAERFGMDVSTLRRVRKSVIVFFLPPGGSQDPQSPTRALPPPPHLTTQAEAGPAHLPNGAPAHPLAEGS